MDFLFRNESSRGHAFHIIGKACGFCAPEENLQVAQPTGAFFEIGFQCVRGIFKAMVASRELQHLVAVKVRHI